MFKLSRCVVCWTIAAAVAAGLVPGTTEPADAQRESIVLRDLTLLKNVTITALDADGIVLTTETNSGVKTDRTVRWHEVLKGNVGSARQAEFDAMQATIGETSFRLLLRLRRNEVAALRPAYDRLRELADAHASSGYTRYLASAAELRWRLDRDDRAACVEPLFALLAIRESVEQKANTESNEIGVQTELAEIDALCELRFSSEGLFLPLLPVWSESDRESLRTLTLDDRPPDGQVGALYWYSLAIGQGQSVNWDQSGLDPLWRHVLTAQSALIANAPDRAIDALANLERGGAAELRAIALYYRGMAEWLRHEQSIDKQRGEDLAAKSDRHGWLLYWLAIPANHEASLREFCQQVLRDARNRIDRETDSELHRRLSDLVRRAERPSR